MQISYTITDTTTKTAKVTRSSSTIGYHGNVTIQTTFTRDETIYKVIGIEDGAFSNCKGLTSVTIPQCVTTIEDCAFEGCTNLKKIYVLAGTPPTICNYNTFKGCYDATLYVPTGTKAEYQSATYWEDFANIVEIPCGICGDNATWILCDDTLTICGRGEMDDCWTAPWDEVKSYIKRIVIENGITTIGKWAFNNCSGVTKITIPDSVKRIEDSAFRECTRVESIVVDSGNTNYDSRNNCNAIIETTTNTLVVGCKNTIIPNSVTSIEEFAFSGCTGLTSINIPNSVKRIEDSAFRECTRVESIVVDSGNTNYDSRNNCNAIIETTTNTLVVGCKNTIIPNSVTSIEEFAFSGCTGLTSINIPNNVTTIGFEAFSGCTGLTSINIPNSVTSIEGFAFSGCTGLTSINIPNSVTTIGFEAFRWCTGLTSINIPNSVETIEERAFSGCTGLTNVTIPDSVRRIEDSAFRGCTSLTIVQINDLAAWCKISFRGVNSNPLLYARNLYLNGELVTDLVLPDSVKEIEQFAFFGCSITSITIPESVKRIGGSAFSGCTRVESIVVESGNTNYDSHNNCNAIIGTRTKALIVGCKNTIIPNSVKTIGKYAFRWCTGLTSINIPNSVETIEERAFSGCTGLTNVTIPDSVKRIEDSAFRGCTRLTIVHINDLAAWCKISFRWVNSNPLLYARNLYLNGELVTDLILPDSVKEIKEIAFFGCSSITSITIPDSVKRIGNSAFSGCTRVESIVVDSGNTNYDSRNNCNAIIETTTNTLVVGCKNTIIPNSVRTIGHSAFCGCTGLTSVTIPDSVKIIWHSAFSGCTGLTSINIPNSVTTIGFSAFNGCTGLTSITIPNSIRTIGDSAFRGCTGLTSITIPDSVKRIEDSAFSGCTGLTSIYISNSVEEIGECAFKGCTDLKKIYVQAKRPPTIVDYNSLEDCYNATLYVPLGRKATYQVATYWKDFTNIVEID